MSDNIQLTANGIQKVLKKYDYRQAIAEYIWNGFDAKASIVQLNFTGNTLGFITKLEIIDNGYGIPRDKLKEKFKPFYESEKAIEIENPKNTSAIHGKNGVGRLTFFKFCTSAKWQTTYQEGKKIFTYPIQISIETLNKYDAPPKLLKEVTSGQIKTGTQVSFYSIIPEITFDKLNLDLRHFLCLEFGWYLELNRHNNFQLLLNGKTIDYSSLIKHQESQTWKDKETKKLFEIKYILWHERINKEYSKFYFIGSDNKEKYKEYTSLNNKGDHYYHSVYVKGEYFDHFSFKSISDSIQLGMIGGSRNDGLFRRLYKHLCDFLQDQRKPFLKEYTERLIDEYENEGVFPYFGTNSWDKFQKTELENVVKGLYEVQPTIFTNLNIEQKKTFVRLLNLILDCDEREKLFEILNEVIDLSNEDREQMAALLKVTKLNKINQTIRLIEDRYKTIGLLKELVFNKSMQANEVDHLQKMVESHYWIFGEQYHLVTAAEQKFEEALRRYTYLLKGIKKSKSIEHEDKLKEMDIFLCRQDILTNEIKNIIVELKHPDIKLGEKELTQVKTYMNVIINEPEFNGNNTSWEFYLIGKAFNKKREIENALENAKPHGEKSLVFKSNQYKIFVKTWNEVFNDFELKHQFLNAKLQIEREGMDHVYKSAKDIISEGINNSAITHSMLFE